jgi:hypothetical protein
MKDSADEKALSDTLARPSEPTPPPATPVLTPVAPAVQGPQQHLGVALQFGGPQSPEVMALQRVSPADLAEALKRAHELEEKKLAAQERHLEREGTAEENQRERDHQLVLLREQRRWTVGYLILGAFVALVVAVFYTQGGEAAVKTAKDLGLYVLAFIGGMGAEKVRREWSTRRPS